MHLICYVLYLSYNWNKIHWKKTDALARNLTGESRDAVTLEPSKNASILDSMHQVRLQQSVKFKTTSVILREKGMHRRAVVGGGNWGRSA